MMYEELYSLATLKPEEVEEIKDLEARMSERTGQRISLIAYQADVAGGQPD